MGSRVPVSRQAEMEALPYAILISIFFGVQCDDQVQPSSNVEVKLGEEALLECKIPSSISFCTFVSPSNSQYTIKKGLSHDDGRITYNGEDESKDCGIKINNVQEKDNGDWKCVLTVCESGNCKQEEGVAEVTVIKAPKRVYIENQGPDITKLYLAYPSIKEKQIECVAEGARPAPTFSWLLGDKPLTGQLSEIQSKDSDQEDMRISQTLTYIVNPDDHGKVLSCAAQHAGFSEEQKAAETNKAMVTLDISYPPIASDVVLDLYGFTIGNPEVVRINVKSHPPPTEVLWEMQDGTQVRQGSESPDQRFKADQIKPGPSDGRFTAKLMINEFSESNTEGVHKLVVSNSEGSTPYVFRLQIGEKPPTAPAVSDSEGAPSPVEAGQSPTVAILVIVASLIVLTIVGAVVAKSRRMFCFADSKNMDELGEKFDDVEKGEGSLDKESIHGDSISEKKEPEVNQNEGSDNNLEKDHVNDSDERKSNGAHTPV